MTTTAKARTQAARPTIMERLKRRVGKLKNKKLRNRIYATKDFIQSLPNPILIYQMAKVGSTSVYQSMRASGLTPLHVHFLTKRKVKRTLSHYERNSYPPMHLYVSQLLLPYLQLTSHSVQVITLVRDPIARFVSGQYQNPERNGVAGLTVEDACQELVRRLSKPRAMQYTFGWFDREMKSALDVDVMAESFDRERGFIRCQGPRADVLVLKLERLSDLLPTVVSDFVGASLQPVRANVGARKETGSTYKAVCDALHVPATVADTIYAHDWVRHFYTPQEIKTFKARWTVEEGRDLVETSCDQATA